MTEEKLPQKVNLLGFDAEGLKKFCEDLGEKPFRAKQLERWIHRRGARDFSEMTDLAKSFRAKLEKVAEIRGPEIIRDKTAADGTRKWLLDVGSGNAVEMVYIPQDGRGTLCVSSQAGCAMNCLFCSTGKQGFNRNLKASEIIGQLWHAEHTLRKDLGITDEEVADQYQYTKDVMTDSDGNLKGLSWQGCPGTMIYRRDIAKEVFGSDDPAEVQKKVADWDTFKATAAELKEKGYQMTSTVNDSYRVFSNNVTSPWVVDGKITVDDNIKNWVDMSKEMVDAGETATYELWSDDWSKGFFKDSNVFAYFGPAWFIDFSMSADQDGSVGKDGGWAATEGPQGFYWGGTWITAATGTNNPTLVADIMRTMTTNVDVMKEIVTADNDFVNNKPAMEEMAADESYGDAVLGGQNPLAMFCAGADKIDLSDMSIYDQGCNEEFQNAMKNYFEGNASYDEALDLFYKAVVEKYLELTY